MSDRDQRRLVFHGAVVLMIGNLLGVPFADAITRGAHEAAQRWRTAHVGIVAGGVMLIALGPALRHVTLAPGAAAWLVWSLVAAGYASLVGLGLGAATGMRGLEPTGPAMNLVVYAGNFTLAVGALLGIALVIWGARR